MFYFTQINSLHFHYLKLLILSDFEISVLNTRVDWNATHESRRDGNRGIAASCSLLAKERRDYFIPEGVNSLGTPQCLQLSHLFLLLSPIRCLCLSLRISSAQHPFLFGLIHALRFCIHSSIFSSASL